MSHKTGAGANLFEFSRGLERHFIDAAALRGENARVTRESAEQTNGLSRVVGVAIR